MATQSTSAPATEGQFKQMRRLVEDAAEKAARQLGLDKDAMQRLVEFGVVGLVPHFVTLFTNLAVTNEFADEEVESGYGYLSGYEKADAHAGQFAAIKRLFPQVESYDTVLAAKDALPGTEGNFLILPWQKIAPTYEQAVEIIFGNLSEQRGGKFYNCRAGELGSNRLRETQKKVDAMKALAEAQKGHDVVVVSAQLGLRHRGRSVRRARVVMNGNEFGLGAYEMGFILLTHPNRLEQYDDLWIDCAGDEYRFGSSGGFLRAPYFAFGGDELEFLTLGVAYPLEHYGAASAFVPASSPE